MLSDNLELHLPKHTLIGASIMPSELMDKIGTFWDENKDKAHKGLSGDMYTKESKDIDISVDDFSEPWGDYRKYLQLCLKDYFKEYPESDTMQQAFDIHESYNLQWYAKGGGFKSWHHENAGNLLHIHRHLVFMTYIDDVPDAGTFFKYQEIVTPSQKGLTLIWPAGFTHVHKGQITEKHEKRIVTGWYSYDEMLKTSYEIFNKTKDKIA